MCTNLDLKIFDGQDKSELSMIEVAHAILAHHGEAMAFVDLTNEVQQYLGKSDEEIRERLSQFYTDLNIDGSFISLGDNTWGLRAWYPYESIDEATVGENEDEEEDDRPKKKRRKVNAFLADSNDDDDVIDYDNDDPEDDDLDDQDDNNSSDDDDNYDEENDEFNDDDELDDSIEDQLSELHDEDDDDDEDDE